MHKINEYRVLIADLSAAELSEELLPETVYRKYLGGWNIILHYLLSGIKEKIDPLSPENIFVYATGVLTGIPMGGAGRNAAGAVSPLTGGCALSEAGGFFGVELKKAGYDAIVLKGRSLQPVYISIVNGTAKLQSAEAVWGLTVKDAQEKMRHELGENSARTSLIGPAGEKQVPIACVLNDLSHAHGRGGLGAVLGSKNCKGIIVRGKLKPDWHDPGQLKALAKWFKDSWKTATPSSEMFSDHGTIGFLEALSKAGSLPTYNFKSGSFEGASNITGTTMSEKYLVRTTTCYACPVSCKREVTLSEPYMVDKNYGGPEYETGAAFGSDCGNPNLESILKANELCNAFGVDTISAGSTVAWAMECYEKGLIKKEDTDGIELKFGNHEALIQCVLKIVNNEEIGKVLGKGAFGAAKELGVGEEYAMHVKGQDFPYHEPRVKHGLGLSYAVSPTGADHTHAIHDTAYIEPNKRLQQLGVLEGVPALELSPAKVRISQYEILLNTTYNILLLCNAARLPYRFDVKKVLAAIEGAAGWDMTVFELMKVSERAHTMARVMNIRQGLKEKDDYLPKRLFEKLEDSPKSKQLDPEEFREALHLFYELMGWDAESGIPKRFKLVDLNLEWLSDENTR